jgi:membrane fusion protein (multidrug efflux system)
VSTLFQFRQQRRLGGARFTRFLAVGLILHLIGCSRDRPEEIHRDATAPIPVRTAVVQRVVTPGLLPITGTVRSLEHATVAARVMGAVAGADFAIGQQVSIGDALCTLHAPELHARLEQARAVLDQAKRDAARERTLLSQGASTAEVMKVAEDLLRRAQGAFNEAETLVSYTRVTAPYTGVITKKLVRNGDFAAPGTPLFEIEAGDRMRAEVEVPESLSRLEVGSSVRVSVGDTLVEGRVAETSAAVHPSTRTRSAIVELPGGNEGVYSGKFVRVLWPAGSAPRLFVPVAAVQSFGQIERVFVVKEGRVTMRIVKSGVRENDLCEILSGLNAGEVVVVGEQPTLRDGHPVNVLP